MENLENGGKKGRPCRLSQLQLSQALDLHLREGVPIREIADLMGVSHMTVWRALGAEIRGDEHG